MVTVADVSLRAGVSKATASRVLSKRGYVSEKAKSAVLAAAAELGYVPNAVARILRTQKSGFIAFIVPEIINDFYTTLSRGVEDVANNNGYYVVLGNTDENVVKEKNYIELMIANAVEGMIIAPSGSTMKNYRMLADRGIPTILVDRSVKGFSSDLVRSDDRMGAALLTDHLIGLGHRRICLVNGHPDTSVAVDRAAGFEETCRRAGLDAARQHISWGSWFIEEAETRVDALVRAKADFTALIGANIFMTIGALRALRRHKIRVPEDVALVSFNDLDLAAEIDPFLTALSQPIYTMGRIAMDLLLERIEKRYDGRPREVVLSPQLIVRRSCGSNPLPTQPAASGPPKCRKSKPVSEPQS